MKTVTVVLALYEPHLDWLSQQLTSIEQQTYQALELLALDDGSTQFEAIQQVFGACLHHVPFKILHHMQNQGSTACFEQLTGMVTSDYISYCDQDDVWEPGKTARLVAALEAQQATLCYSDLSVIDETGQLIAPSLRTLRKRLVHREGDKLGASLLLGNFTNGTALLMPTKIAQEACPFVSTLHADHWLTLWAAAQGLIAYVPQPLVRYRLHGDNQSATLAGVTDRETYRRIRIERQWHSLKTIQTRLASKEELLVPLGQALAWCEERLAWFDRGDWRAFKTLFKLRRIGRTVTAFELVTARWPEPLFRCVVRLIQHGMVG